MFQVVREITYFPSGVMVKTEDKVYRADYVMVSVSLGVLQTDLIRFRPQLPVSTSNWCYSLINRLKPLISYIHNWMFNCWKIICELHHQTWKIVSIYQFDMALYTKIFLKFPKKFWPEGPGTEFFLYASGRRGYYPVWQVKYAMLAQTLQQHIYMY